ncbi:hypothetical protein IHE45_09G029700 [Dioscorea alata]|uniref:Uncharacterized protein n=2 Tax=Dioscorea alata TaxID=55571 RepID=A0ACB7VE66_DIOAL|nr:hypothetical protein IHE45_09G029600 [Dioscorea alata]KAH7672075.1 hypothetical protein IHE45_09G029700 [Dioscorea alata]
MVVIPWISSLNDFRWNESLILLQSASIFGINCQFLDYGKWKFVVWCLAFARVLCHHINCALRFIHGWSNLQYLHGLLGNHC